MGPALDVAVAADGAVYVTDGRSVCTFAKDGSVVGTWVVDEEWDPYRPRVRGLAAGRGKAVCVGVDNVVKFFSRKGRLVREVDATVPPPDCIYWPRGIAVSPDGVVYVADNYKGGMACFAADGEPLGWWGRRALPVGDSIDDVAWCADGTVAVLFGKKSESMRAHVAFYGPKGEFLYEWPVIVGRVCAPTWPFTARKASSSTSGP
jgi:DNA-binding beta-propeller fold protein YncE